MMIKTDKGHIWLTFDNGYTVSIFNGFGSYSDNHFKTELLTIPEFASIDSKNCEVAITYGDSVVTKEILNCDDNVKGYVGVNELAEIINKVKNL